MSKIDLNEVAKQITLSEGKIKILNIGDVKEVLKIIFTMFDLPTICKIWFKFNK